MSPTLTNPVIIDEETDIESEEEEAASIPPSIAQAWDLLLAIAESGEANPAPYAPKLKEVARTAASAGMATLTVSLEQASAYHCKPGCLFRSAYCLDLFQKART